MAARSVDNTSSHPRSPEAASDESSTVMDRTSVAPPESRGSKKKRKSKGKVKGARNPASERPSTSNLERASARELPDAASTDPDDISVPPVGDVGFDDDVLTEWLERHEADYAIEGGALTVLDTASRKAEPEVVERRTRFSRYVQWVVGGAFALCAIAGVRTAISSNETASPAISRDVESRVATTTQGVERSPSGAAVPVVPKAAEPRVAPIADDSNVPLAVAAKPQGASLEASQAASAAAEQEASPLAQGEAPSAPSEASQSAAEHAATASEATEPSAAKEARDVRDVKDDVVEAHGSSAAAQSATAKEAKVAKEKARASLEKGRISEAIEAGTRAVAIDPTDGESWLLLGAAYQEKGVMAEARRAYTSCVKEAKTGPRRECMKMLQ